MAEFVISEQDIVNAICIDQARKHQLEPEQVEVELFYDDDDGFSAEVFCNGQKQILNSFNMIQAIRLWIEEVLGQDPYAAGIKLLLDREEGIIASVH